MKQTILFVSFIVMITAQGMGNGVSKSTWAASNPRQCLKFFKTYLPSKEAKDDCTDGKCECATQGRTQLENFTPFGGFGLHTINCTQHPYGEQSLMDIETKIQSAWGDFSSFHPFMDYNLGLWAPNLDDYVTNFQKDNVPFVGLKWKSDDGKDYYSIIVNACGYVVLELMGDKVTNKNLFTKTDKMRFSFNSRNQKPSWQISSHLTALKISRSTNRMDLVKQFYTKDFGVNHLTSQKYDDGSELQVYMYKEPHQGIQLHFWTNTTATEETETSNSYTVKEFEDYLHSVHQKYMITDVCGFDQWMDNHYAYDGQNDLGMYVKVFKKLGLQYHWWSGPGGGGGGQVVQLYGVDPTGWGIQFDGMAQNAPSKLPTYSAACKSDDGCAGQGSKVCSSLAQQFWKY